MGAEPEGSGLALPGRLYYLDASLPLPLCEALALVRDDVLYPEGPNSPVDNRESKDVEWLPIVGGAGMNVLMRDKKIRTRNAERDRLIEYGVGAFCLTGAGNYSRWRILDLLVRRWAEIEATADSEVPPYIYSVTQGGLKRLL